MGKKLNLDWVSDAIGDNYKKWKTGDVILLQAQTGTGKTYFIKNVLIPHMEFYENMLIVCNRRYLKRQIKLDLIKKLDSYGLKLLLNDLGIDSIDDITNETLDGLVKIGNVTIMSYHAVQYAMLDKKYNNKDYYLFYDYIVCDECHYFFADASFNNKTELAFNKLLEHESMSKKICKCFKR